MSPETLENPNRRPYHLAAGFTICTAIYTAIVVGVRVVFQ